MAELLCDRPLLPISEAAERRLLVLLPARGAIQQQFSPGSLPEDGDP